MRVSFLKHDCQDVNPFVAFLQRNVETVHQCPFHWKMRGGGRNIGSIHYFTLFGHRLVLDLMIKRNNAKR